MAPESVTNPAGARIVVLQTRRLSHIVVFAILVVIAIILVFAPDSPAQRLVAIGMVLLFAKCARGAWMAGIFADETRLIARDALGTRRVTWSDIGTFAREGSWIVARRVAGGTVRICECARSDEKSSPIILHLSEELSRHRATP